MESIFEAITLICNKIQVVSDLFWDFPCNLDFYKNIPILGNFSLAIILLVGSGIYFTIRLLFIQVRYFKKGIEILKNNQKANTGISPLASFFLSTAMRVGPGNILGVTGAITTGGPGALFWMWISAFFGMATAFTESTLSQIFKEKKDDEYIGGMAFYGRRLLGDSKAVGVFLSILYIVYALLCFPAQGFNTVSSIGQMGEVIIGRTIPTDSVLYWVSFAILILFLIFVSIGGIKRVTKVTDLLSPIMSIIYVVLVIIIILLNLDKIPYFFYAVFTEAFKPNAIFGGTFGIVISQGVKRGLMSNEAGQGTITMPAAASDAAHPVEQGLVQSIGVFLDTIIICSFTGFVVIMASLWLGDNSAEFMELGKLPKFITSIHSLAPTEIFKNITTIVVTLCFGLFALTCLLGFLSFSEICANRISQNKLFINFIRFLCIVVVSFGVMTYIMGKDLSALWNLSDFGNILIAYCNIPLLYLGFKYVLKATKHYEKNDGTKFDSSVVGTEVKVWDEKN